MTSRQRRVRQSETVTRSLAKAISYRCFSSLITFGITFVISGNEAVALTVGVVDAIAKLVGYFAHERMWIFLDHQVLSRKKQPAQLELEPSSSAPAATSLPEP